MMTAVTAPLQALKRDAFYCSALAFAVAWALLLRFSALFFEGTSPVSASGISSVCILAVLVAGTLFARPLHNHMETRRGAASVITCSALAATGASAITLAAQAHWWDMDLEALPIITARGTLSGLAFLGCSHAALRTYGEIGTRHSLSIAAVGTSAAYLLYLAAVSAWPLLSNMGREALMTGVAALPCLAAACWLTGERRCPTQAAPTHQANRDACQVAFGPLPMLVGFLAVFMPTMYPKTTNYAPVALGGDACLGLASMRCVVALALFCAVLWAAAALANGAVQDTGRSAAVAFGTFASIALFASVFFSLPSMSSSPVPFVLITACSIPLALAVASALARQGGGAARRGFIAMSVAGLAAAIFSCVFLGPLYNVLPYQDELFSIIPAIVLVLVAFSGLWAIRKSHTHVKDFAGNGCEVGDHAAMGTNSLAVRCTALGERCGLTKREMQVLELLAEGRNEPYVEKQLAISRSTVKTHIAHIYRKVGVTTRQQLLDALHESARP